MECCLHELLTSGSVILQNVCHGLVVDIDSSWVNGNLAFEELLDCIAKHNWELSDH